VERKISLLFVALSDMLHNGPRAYPWRRDFRWTPFGL